MTDICTNPPGMPCMLVTRPALAERFRDGMVPLDVYIDTSHESLELWRCRSCGQHWLWWWSETWDFEHGDDPGAATLTPVSGPEEARLVAAPPGSETPRPAPRGQLLRRWGKGNADGWRWSEPA